MEPDSSVEAATAERQQPSVESSQAALSNPGTSRLDADQLAAIVHTVRKDAEVVVLDSVGSTNAYARDALFAGTLGHGSLVTTDEQTAGRGRLGRAWESPRGAMLASTVIVETTLIPPQQVPWLTLMMGVSVASVLRARYRIETSLKWPNDVLIGGVGKVCGILAELVPIKGRQFALIGFGVNVHQRADQMPAGGMSLRSSGAPHANRTEVLGYCYTDFMAWVAQWLDADGDPAAIGLYDSAVRLTNTIGRKVRVQYTDGTAADGLAVGLSETGHLIVDFPDKGAVEVTAGDVLHLRGADINA